MKPQKITAEEWIRELTAITTVRRESPGLTSREIAEHMGCCVDVALNRLRRAKALGVLRVGKRVTEGVDGRRQPQTVYWIEPRKSSR